MDDGSRPTANASLNEAELGEYCRRRGIYAEQLVVWRAACARANDWERAASRQIARETRDANKRIQQLERELARKEKALAEAAALMVLRKKAEAIRDDARSGPAGSGRPVDGPKQVMPRAPAWGGGGRRGRMTSAQDRRLIAALIDEATAAGASVTAACAALGLSPRTLQRWRRPTPPTGCASRSPRGGSCTCARRATPRSCASAPKPTAAMPRRICCGGRWSVSARGSEPPRGPQTTVTCPSALYSVPSSCVQTKSKRPVSATVTCSVIVGFAAPRTA